MFNRGGNVAQRYLHFTMCSEEFDMYSSDGNWPPFVNKNAELVCNSNTMSTNSDPCYWDWDMCVFVHRFNSGSSICRCGECKVDKSKATNNYNRY